MLFVVVRDRTPSDGARVAFYGDGWSAAGVLIAPIDAGARSRGGRHGRRRGGPLAGGLVRDAANPSAARPDAGQPIRYELARRGSPVAVDVTWSEPAIGRTLLDGWSVILFSLAFAAVAAFVFARRPREPAATALMIAACGAAGSSVPWFLGVTVSDLVHGGPFLLHAVVTGPLYMLLWPAGLHLALVFPTALPAVARRRWLIPAVYALGLGGYALGMLVGLAASPTGLDWVGTWPLAQCRDRPPAGPVDGDLRPTLRPRARPGGPGPDPLGHARRRRERRAWPGEVHAPEMLFRRTLLPDSWIGLTALPLLGLAAGILRDRLFDIDVVVNRTLVYGGLTLGVVATYVGVTSGIGAAVGSEHGFGVSPWPPASRPSPRCRCAMACSAR
jgi:hypothetical protein